MNWISGNVSERRVAPPTIAVSTVIFGLRPQPPHAPEGLPDLGLWLPLVRRIREPFLGRWALPGGPLQWDESLVDVAFHTLRQVTDLEPAYLEQLYAFGSPDRSPAQRVVSVVYWAFISGADVARASQPTNVEWFPADDLPELAFDHERIIGYALCRVRSKVEYSQIASTFLGETFTIAQLREVTEAIRGQRTDAANFRRQLLASGAVIATGDTATLGRHRPARLYRVNPDVVLASQLPNPESLGVSATPVASH